MRICILLIPAVLLVGCGKHTDIPEGFEASCYGDDFSKYLVGKDISYSAKLDLPISQWDKLKTVLQAFSEENGLSYFDTEHGRKLS